MKSKIGELCCGCLSSDRKMKALNDYWSREAFLKFLTEMPLQMDGLSLWLCWECETRISTYIKFKEQLDKCWKFLQDYVKETNKPHPKTLSKLVKCTLEKIDYNANNTSQINEECDVKMTDSQPDLEVKVELDTFSDDDRTLMDIITDDREKDLHKIDSNVQKDTKVQEEVRKSEIRENEFQGQESSKRRKRSLKKEKKPKVKRKGREELKFEEIEITYEEILEEQRVLASKEDYVNAMFKCDKCIVPFANEDDLKDHVQNKHSVSSKHICDICTRSFTNNGSLAVHLKRHYTRWRCTECRATSAAAHAALAHYTRTHTRPTGEIHDLAAKAFGTFEEKLQENFKISLKSSEEIPCEYCNKTFRWKTSLRKHMETHKIESGHKRRPYCEPCNLTFATSSNLKKHMQDSSKHQIQLRLRKLKEASPVESSDPMQQVKDIESIKSSIISQKEKYPCPQCEKIFQWKGNLWRHLQSHAARANGGLVCEPCNRKFSSIATYKQHMEISRKHVTENEFKYMCSECGKRFYSKSKLRDHIDWEHLKNYTHTCSECQKVFKSHTSLYLHRQVVHKLNNASHLCHHCGKSFPNKTKLRSHVSGIHTKDSPYKCPTCSAKFSWHSCLSRHMRRVHKFKPTPG